MHSVLLGIRRAWLLAILVAAVTASSAIVVEAGALAAPGDDGQEVFQQKCQSCHSIGQGKRVGPDLQGITSKRDKEWLVAFITAPDRLIAQGDPIAKQLVQEFGMPMPNLGISSKDAEALLAYIDATGKPAAAPAGGPQPAVAQPPALAVEAAGNAILGRELFIGETSFQNGGAACVSCHTVSSLDGLGGGTLARDLSQTYANLGFQGVQPIVANPPFPAMKTAFGTHPLTDAEVANLIAFLRQESAYKDGPANGGVVNFVLLGMAGCVIFLGLIQLAWPRRLQGVRQALVGGRAR